MVLFQKALLANGADINASDDSGTTALIGAAKCGRSDVVGALISAGKSNENSTRLALMFNTVALRHSPCYVFRSTQG